ncbi:MAG: FAD-dependent oxidoreductase [Hyphomicrobiales bacterium]|nr:FAD-dependent oxidoreductase [Hyphomicrobiales bacterium]
MRVRVIGAGIFGLTAAYELARRGARVDLVEAKAGPGLGCSFLAGGMIAPWCERESAEPIVTQLGLEGLDFWTRQFPVAVQTGSLVVAPARDKPEVERFSRRTSAFEICDGPRIGALEPDLARRFAYGLFFPHEAYVEPRAAMKALALAIAEFPDARVRYGLVESPDDDAGFDWTVDCRGFAARRDLPDLRGVKGEMLILRTRDVKLSRPVRMLHPRHPVYIVPHGPHHFMVGATMIENEEPGRVTARGMMELLGAAYTLHPAFGEAEIVETGADVRPSFPDNLPRLALRPRERRLFINGAYRHGFLLGPALAKRAADIILDDVRQTELLA